MLASAYAIAQQPASIHLTEKDGLPDIEFYNITEDSKNYIWLASDKGLYRYNGRSFEYYVHSSQKGNAVFGTKEDHLGRIWCNNISGQFFYTENEALKLFIDLGDKLYGELAEFIVTKKELIVFAGNIIRINLETKAITQVSNNHVFLGAIEEISDGYLYSREKYIINANKSLVTRDSLQITTFLRNLYDAGIKDKIRIASNEKINLCYFLKNGRNEFYRFDIKKTACNPISIPNQLQDRRIFDTYFHDDTIWFSTDLGLYICRITNNNLVLDDIYFKDKFITKVIKDSEANYWIITKGDGIFIIPNINIHKYENKDEKLNITHLEKLKKHLMVFGTTDGKVGVLHTKELQVSIIDSRSSSRVTEIKSLPKSNETFVIKEDASFKLDHKTEKIKKLYSFEFDGAKSLSKINDSAYVLSSYRLAKIVDDEYKFVKNIADKRSYANYYSTTAKNIYVATVDGLYAYNNKLHKTPIFYKNKPIYAKDIVETEDQKIWVSTFNDGVFCIKGTVVIDYFGTDDGLLSKRISTIKNDENYLWIATEQGIQYLHSPSKAFKNLTKQNGVPSYRISDIEIDEDRVLFATNTGFFSVDKTKAFKGTKIPKVYINEVSIGLKSMALRDQYKFDYDENSIKISFNANGFNSFLNNKYEFRLLGQSNVWQTDNNGSNSVIYYGLPSGDYTFEVRSVLANNSDTDSIDSVHFSISKPFWREWWFYIGLIFSAVLAAFALFKRKINALKKEQSEILEKELINKQLILSQLENLRSQMNPHFIFNALNSIQEYIVFNEKELASSYLIKFSRLIRIYLEHSRDSEVFLSEELNALNIYLELEKNRFEEVLEFTINVEKSIHTNTIKIPSLFIQPYVENALKHGLLHKIEDRKLIIDFTMHSDTSILFCCIKDNGIGIKASKAINQAQNPQHKSFATSANEKRVELLNANRVEKIKVETKSTNKGTEVLITIPIT
ncbi:sensor histidine kinase YpdA [Kordia sp. SMS9]|nr:sensor histidine kinase YpdA [Kordia sp. SMS9]